MPQAEDTLSTASTLTPSSEVRTSLTGRPIKPYEHDSLSNTVSGESFQTGVNLLPPGYTDSSLVHIPIKVNEYLAPTTTIYENDVKRDKPRKGSVFSRISDKISGNGGAKGGDDVKVVQMSRGDYLKYWAKDEDGKFRVDVVEPPEGRAEWLTRALEKQQSRGNGEGTSQSTKGTEGRSGAFGAAGSLIGGVAN